MEIRKIDEKYSISDEGEVFRNGGILVRPVTCNGKLKIKLHRTNKILSRLLLETFIGPKPLNHWDVCIDGNQSNMKLSNWRWDWTESIKTKREKAKTSKARIKASKAKQAKERALIEGRRAEREMLKNKAEEVQLLAQKFKKKKVEVKDSRIPSNRKCADCGTVFRSIKKLKCPKCSGVKPYIIRYSL